jgi:hypothetical protein
LDHQEYDLLESDRTYCGDSDCPMRSECQRFYADEGTRWQFVNSPRKDNICDLFWGKTQDSIVNTLEEVMGK